MLTAAVGCTDAKRSGSLRALLEQTGLVKSVVEWTVPSRGEWTLSPGEIIPDVVMLCLSRDTESCFAFAAHLRRLRPTVRIIACSSTPQQDPDVLLQAMRSGVQEFLAEPINPTMLEETLARFVQEGGATRAGPAEKMMVVMGTKGGVGTSTVAVNLSVQLAQITQKRVVLLDFSRPLGHVSLLLDLHPRFSIRDATENLERLDGHFLGGLLTHHKSGLEVLAGTSHPDEWQRFQVSALARLVNVAQSSSDFVVIDFGSVYSSEWRPILGLARVVLLVAEASVPALGTLERHLSAIAALGIDPEQIRIVINRWHRRDEEALKSVEKNIKRPIFARLPNDFRQVSEATNLGVPLSENHNDPLVTKFREMAGRLVGIVPAAGEKRSAFTNLFSSPSKR